MGKNQARRLKQPTPVGLPIDSSNWLQRYRSLERGKQVIKLERAVQHLREKNKSLTEIILDQSKQNIHDPKESTMYQTLAFSVYLAVHNSLRTVPVIDPAAFDNIASRLTVEPFSSAFLSKVKQRMFNENPILHQFLVEDILGEKLNPVVFQGALLTYYLVDAAYTKRREMPLVTPEYMQARFDEPKPEELARIFDADVDHMWKHNDWLHTAIPQTSVIVKNGGNPALYKHLAVEVYGILLDHLHPMPSIREKRYRAFETLMVDDDVSNRLLEGIQDTMMTENPCIHRRITVKMKQFNAMDDPRHANGAFSVYALLREVWTKEPTLPLHPGGDISLQ